MINKFLKYLKVLKRSELTRTAYKTDITHFFNFLTAKKLTYQTVDRKSMNQYVARLSQEGLKPRSIHRRIMALKTFYNYLIDNDIVYKNPATRIMLPEIPIRMPRHLTFGQMQIIFENLEKDKTYAGKRDLAILELLYYAPRHSDIRDLTMKQLDLKNRQIKVIGKGNREIVYPFGENCTKALIDYLKIRRVKAGQRAVFTHHGKQLTHSMLINIVKRRCSVVRKGVSPHWFRHSCAVHLHERGADIREIQEVLHHRSIATTQIYTHISGRRLRGMLESKHPRA